MFRYNLYNISERKKYSLIVCAYWGVVTVVCTRIPHVSSFACNSYSCAYWKRAQILILIINDSAWFGETFIFLFIYCDYALDENTRLLWGLLVGYLYCYNTWYMCLNTWTPHFYRVGCFLRHNFDPQWNLSKRRYRGLVFCISFCDVCGFVSFLFIVIMH